MEIGSVELLSETSFCTCSYLKSLRNHRAYIVRKAMESWEPLLELPFAEKLFFDDCSPNINGIRLLQMSNSLNKFDEVKYNTQLHPPHSNFGIVHSMTLCRSNYILHIDDDINMTSSVPDCLDFINRSLAILEEDKNILGINILTMPIEFEKDWFPGEDYYGSEDFAHPQKYFGTAACLIKKQLLEQVSLNDIVNWGAQQPNTWEKLVSDNTASFLVSKVPTPFGLDLDAWVYQSTSGITFKAIKKKIKYNLGKKLPFLKRGVESWTNP